MQEARYSVNLKFNYQGFDTQLTLREEESLNELLKKFRMGMEVLQKLGATPERRWEVAKNGGNGNGKVEEGPRCFKCGSLNLKLIAWQRNGEERQALKCQDCNTWQPSQR